MIFIMINNKGYHLLKRCLGAPPGLKAGKQKPAGSTAIKPVHLHKNSLIK